MLHGLVKNEKISMGKAAGAMGVEEIGFIIDLGKMNIPHFDCSIGEVIEEVKNAHLHSENL